MLAASAMAAVPTLVFFLIFQRNILSGLTAGSRAFWAANGQEKLPCLNGLCLIVNYRQRGAR